MSAVDQLLNSGSNSVGQYTFIDADTLRDANGNKYRLQGYDAPEINKLKNNQLRSGTAGGAIATSTITGLAESQGFTNLVKTGQKDAFGRDVVELRDDTGRNFTTVLAQSGILQPGKFTSQDDLDAAEVGRILRDRGGEGDSVWDKARTQIQEGIEAEQFRDIAFKQQAVNEAQLAGMKQYGGDEYFTGSTVQFRNPNRTLENVSTTPFSDSWEKGWIGVRESAYGALNMLGETTGLESLADIGEAGVNRARLDMQDYGTALMDYKDVKSFGTAMEYLSNNFAMSLPYMAITTGGALAGGVGLLAPASIYSGQVWNEQEEKNAAVAIGAGVLQAAFDRIGLAGIAGAGKVPSKLWKEGVAALVAKGMTKELAEQTIAQSSRKVVAGLVGDAAEIARKQIAAKVIFQEMAKKGLTGAATEGVTEGLQEAIGYTGANWDAVGGNKPFNFEELNERIMAGMVAGTALGGALSVPGSLYDAGAWADVAVRQAPADAARLSQSGRHSELERQQFGRVQSIEELNAINRGAANARTPNSIPTMKERIDLNKQRKKDRTFSDVMSETIAATPALWRGATRFIFNPDLQDRSRSARVLADMFGGNLQRVFSGSSYENAKHHRVTQYKNMVPMPDQFYSAWTGGKQTSRKKREAISADAYRQLQQAIDADGNFNPDLLPESDHKGLLLQMQQQLQSLSDKMYADQTQAGGELGKLNNYLLRYKSFNKKAIHQNKHKFANLLADEFNMPINEAMDIADAITESVDINDISDALTAHGAAGKPGSHKSRNLNLAENEAFQEFMNQDMFSNINDAAKSAARFVEYNNYIGQNQEIVNELLHQMEQEGISADEVNKVAAQLQDYFDAESGNYKRPDSAFWKRMQTAQRNFMMVTTIAGLPLATISSFVEMALTMKGLTMDQLFGTKGKPGGLMKLGNELGDTLWKGAQEVTSLATNEQRLPSATRGKELIQNLGFYDWDVGAATTTGVSETNPWQQTIYENFFKWIGLQGWTNFTRAARASIAGDFITNHLDTMLSEDGTNAAQESREMLRNLGMNVDDLLNAYQGEGMFDPNKAAILEENFREGVFNFVNEAVALPQAANRPLLYQDPRFSLFTQFQGFIATFTANHIPKLWDEYVKRGTPAMKYSAFATMMTMIMLGFASQYLKDMIKYGKPLAFGPDDHPFLSPSEYAQRGIRASGLLGTGERVLDQFFPLYDKRSHGVGEWAFNGIVGESPALGYAERAGKGIGKGLTGDVGGAAKEATRFVPFVGPFNWIRDAAEQSFDSWNFNGE